MELKVIWIWQPDCKSGPLGSGSSPPGPTKLWGRVQVTRKAHILGHIWVRIPSPQQTFKFKNMSDNKSTASSGIGFSGLLAILFIALKLTGVITWSWLWVLAPIWITFVIVVFILIIAGIVIIANK